MKSFLIIMLCGGSMATLMQAHDILVKKGETIQEVCNLKENDNSYLYTLEPSLDANAQKINQDEAFSINKKNGTMAMQTSGAPASKTNEGVTRIPVTAQLSSEITTRKGRKTLSARTPDGHELHYAVLSEAAHTLTVIKGKYHESSYVIPEYVQINGVRYTVTEIDKEAFLKEKTVKNIQFPSTLKIIGWRAFSFSGLENIILPEGLEEICEEAFWNLGSNQFWGYIKGYQIYEIYIPSTIKKMGKSCFLCCGNITSPNGYCKAYFSNIPNFITQSNCRRWGIHKDAVKRFYSE